MLNHDAPFVKPEIEFIESLLQTINGGMLRIPRFQRPFYWKPSDMLNLFDSIYKGYPIGSLLLWESSEPVLSLDEVGSLKIPRPESNLLTYILDGHQRLATLFSSLLLPKDSKLGLDQDEWRWWIWFDLEKKEFVHVSNNHPLPHLFPLRAVLRTVDFLEESRRIQEKCPKKALIYIEEAEKLATKIKNYKVATTKIRGGSLNEAVDIFSRLNTRGRQMTIDQMVSALTYKEGENAVDLAHRIDEIIERLTVYHFGNIKRLTVFRAIMAAANMNILSSEWEGLAKKVKDGLSDVINDTEISLLKACEFLYKELKLPGNELVPYSHQIVMLSEFFHCCQEPDLFQIDKLKKWFWVTSLSGWFAGANSTQINNAVIEMRSFASDANSKFKVMPLDSIARPYPSNFDMRSARVRTLLLFLLSLKPIDPVTGELIPAEHILREYWSQALPYVFPRAPRQVISNPANRILFIRFPGLSVRDQLINTDECLLENVLKSHAISNDAYDALLVDDQIGFITLRAKHISELETEFMLLNGIRPPRGNIANDVEIDSEDMFQESF